MPDKNTYRAFLLDAFDAERNLVLHVAGDCLASLEFPCYAYPEYLRQTIETYCVTCTDTGRKHWWNTLEDMRRGFLLVCQ